MPTTTEHTDQSEGSIEPGYLSECPTCGKAHEVVFLDFFGEARCPKCRLRYTPVHYCDPARLVLQSHEFVAAMKRFVVYLNAERTHEAYRQGIKAKELVTLFPLQDAWHILSGWRFALWNLSVIFYRFGPTVACIAAIAVSRNWWFAVGIVLSSAFGRAVGEFLKNRMQQFLAVAPFAIAWLCFGYFYGFTHWSSVSAFCVVWRMAGFFVADKLQDVLAEGALLASPSLFEQSMKTGAAYPTRPQAPLAVRTHAW